jgi:beta-lactamase regulating signal transducer with metallopeptidase domain
MMSTILEAALRSLALAIVAAIISRIFLRANPRLELTLWTLVLVGAMAMPLVMQRVPIALFPTLSSSADAPSLGAPEAAPLNVGPSVGAVSDDQPAPAAQDAKLRSPPISVNWRLVAGVVYSAVALFMASRLALGVALAWARWRSATPLQTAAFAGRDVRVARELTAPTTFGVTILLPPSSAGWSDSMWRAVLAHETSHIRRGDFFVQLLAAVHRALFWFSPLAWFLTHRLAELAETLSDYDAAKNLGDRTAYAEALLAIATRAQRGSFGVAMARGPDVAARVERILKEATMQIDISAKWRQNLLIAALLAPTFALAAGASAEDAGPSTAATSEAAEANTPDLDRLVGVYKLGPPLAPDQTVTISRHDNRFYAKWTGGADQEIAVRPNHDFVLEGHHLHVQKVVIKDGAVDTFAFFWRGHFSEAARTDEAEAKRLEALFAERMADQNAPRHVAAIDSKALDGLVGFYLINDQKVFHVTREGDHLYNQTTGQRRVEIYPESEHNFFYTTSATQLTFQTDAQGVASGLILHQYGLERPCPKTPEAVAKPIEDAYANRFAEQHRPHTVSPVDPQSLDSYVGTYQLWPKVFMTATREGDRLFMQVTGQNKFELFPYEKNDFFYTIVAAQISFEMGDDGKARKLTLHQNGWDTPAGRVDPPAKL